MTVHLHRGRGEEGRRARGDGRRWEPDSGRRHRSAGHPHFEHFVKINSSHETKQVTERGACTSSNASAAEGGGANGQSYGSEVNQDTSYPGGANKWCLNIRADGNNGRLLDCTHGVYLVCCAGEAVVARTLYLMYIVSSVQYKVQRCSVS